MRCDCGNQVHVCSDPEYVGYPYRRICQAAMERARAEGLYADLHEKAPYHDGTFTRWSDKRSAEFPNHYGDGVTIGVADHNLTPWDEFTTKQNASPLPSDESSSTSEQPV